MSIAAQVVLGTSEGAQEGSSGGAPRSAAVLGTLLSGRQELLSVLAAWVETLSETKCRVSTSGIFLCGWRSTVLSQ